MVLKETTILGISGVWFEGIWTTGKMLACHLLKDAGPGWENEGYHDMGYCIHTAFYG